MIRDTHHLPASGNGPQAPDVDLDRVWQGIESEIWAQPVTQVERTAGSVLHSPALARALCTTPSLFLSWLLASVAVFAVGAVATRWIGQPLVPLLAPAVAAIAVAFSYGAGADPAYEIARTMPTPARMILLVRVVAVVATNVLIGMLASALAPSIAGITSLWLLPMLAIALLALAIAVTTHSATTGGVVSLAVWGSVLVASDLRRNDVAAAVTATTLQELAPLYVGVTIVSVLVVWWMSGDGARRREMAGWW